MLGNILERFFKRLLRDSRGRARPRTARPRDWTCLWLEVLEDRTAPAVLTVNSTANDANPNDSYLSLPEAIAIVNSSTLPNGLSQGILNQISGALHAGGSDTIQFDPTTVTSPVVLAGTQLVLSLPSSTAVITINGGAAGITVDGNNQSNIFQVYSGVTASLNGLTISHGSSAYDGGGIYNDGTLTISNCTFASNSAGRNGGGIEDLPGSILTISHSTFTGNSAVNNGGGIVNLAGTTLTVSNTSFTGNSAPYGGGIYNVGTLMVNNTIFNANSATFGGGVWGQGALSISNSTFTANSASQGSGVYTGGGTLVVSNSTFATNSASESGGGILNNSTLTLSNSTFDANAAPFGGGIDNGGTLTLSNSTFTSNSASNYGGGISNGGTLTVTDSTFTANSAVAGGAIANPVGNSTVTVGNSTFASNSAAYFGGAIYNVGTLTVSNGTLAANSTTATGTSGGGGIVNTGALTLNNSTIAANSAASGPGGIYNSGTLALGNCIIAGNTDGDITNAGSVQTNNSYNNLIGSGGSGGLQNGVNGNQVGISVTDLGLAPLGNYGGPTQTMALLPGSFAIGKGSLIALPVGLTTDQRGSPRTTNGSLDIGAFQSQGYQLTVTGGVSQNTTVGQSLATPLTVTLSTNDPNVPLKNEPVTFTVVSSGSGAGLSNPSYIVNTDANGQAQLDPSANTISGGYVVTASLDGMSVNFNLANTVAAPASISALYGNGESATVGTAFGTLLEVQVSDMYGNPVPVVPVTFTEDSGAGGAGGTFASNAPVMTNGQGIAIAPGLTADHTAGSFTVTASDGSASSIFSLSNTAGAAAVVSAVGGTSQNAPIGFAYSNRLQAEVADQFGNPVANLPVTFTPPAARGPSASFDALSTVLTNAAGIATAPALAANHQPGSFTITASIGTAVAAFDLTNTAVPAVIKALASKIQQTTVGTAFAANLLVRILDAGNNPVSGISVDFEVPGSSPSGTFAAGRVVTNAQGIAVAPLLTANGVAGSFTAQAWVRGVASPATFTMTNDAGPASAISIAAGNNQTATVGTSFKTNLQALVLDSFGNPVSGASVTFTVVGTSGGAAATFPSAKASVMEKTNSAGVAMAPTLTCNKLAGTFSVTASVGGGASPATYTLSNTADPPHDPAGSAPQSVGVGQNYAPLQARVSDAFGNPIAGVTVTFTAPSHGASGTFSGKLSATAVTAADGLATAPTFTANHEPGSFLVALSVPATPLGYIKLTNLAVPAAAPLAASGRDAGSQFAPNSSPRRSVKFVPFTEGWYW
jgi:hypothetical protein